VPVIHCPDQSQTGVTTASHWLTRLPPGPPSRFRTFIHIRPLDFSQLPAPNLAGGVSPPATPTNFSPFFLPAANFRQLLLPLGVESCPLCFHRLQKIRSGIAGS